MTTDELKKRLKVFALRIIKLSESLPNTKAGHTLGNQIIRSGTSPGANYRSACLGKSEKDFLNKLKMVEEELDETVKAAVTMYMYVTGMCLKDLKYKYSI